MLVAALLCGCSASNTQPSEIAENSADGVAPEPQVREALVTACYGCHSDQTPDPWYARLAPSRWASNSARQALNFSQWQSYSTEKRAAERGLIASVVNSGAMPPADYTFFDRSARLEAEQKQQIAKWASHDGAALPAH